MARKKVLKGNLVDAKDFYNEPEWDYDLMVSWGQRLEREAGFLWKACSDVSAASILDAACGTGMHAVMLAGWGIRCAGADISPMMVERAKQNARAAGASVDFRVAAFGELSRTFTGCFDMVICLGNSLPHLLDDVSLRIGLEDFARVLSPGGMVVIQTRNYDRVIREKARFMPVTSRTEGTDETLFLRITDFSENDPEKVDFTVVCLKKRDGAWSQSARSTKLRALRRQTLEEAVRGCGFSQLRAWGGYDFSAFDEIVSSDLLLTAVKEM